MWAWLKKVFAGMVRALVGLFSRPASTQSTQPVAQGGSGKADLGESQPASEVSKGLQQLARKTQRMKGLFGEITKPNLEHSDIQASLHRASISMAELAGLSPDHATRILQRPQLRIFINPPEMANLYHLHCTDKSFLKELVSRTIPTLVDIYEAAHNKGPTEQESVRKSILQNFTLSTTFFAQLMEDKRSEKAKKAGPGEAKRAASDLPTFDIYFALKVPRDATINDIKEAYMAAVLPLNPGLSLKSDDGRLFRDLNEAYACLIDPTKRAAWDKLPPVRSQEEPVSEVSARDQDPRPHS